MKKISLSNPFVSVIIPTFNRGRIVTEAVESVLAQNYHPFELIVVDDGSTDDTNRNLMPFMENIILIRQKNKGVSSARNTGIKAAKGEFIAFLDSDDLWMQGKLSCQIDFFKSNPYAMICQTQEIWIRNGKRVNPKKKHKKLSGMIFKQSLNLCLVSPSAVMMRKTFFDIKGYFDESLPACEDYDLWLRTLSDTPIYLIDQPFIIKRGGRGDQLSANHSLDKYRIISIKKLLNKNLLTKDQRIAAIEVLCKKCDIYANGCIKRGKKQEAAHYARLWKNFKVQ